MKQRFLWIWMVPLGMILGCNSELKQQSDSSVPSEIKADSGEQQAKGYVFNDQNENRKKDQGEKGIAGVAVSNGKDVVVTSKKGYYALPVSEDNAVFVIKPRDWMTPVNEENLPRFYYLHKPQGSPEHYKYKGVAPTGDLPEEINFPLYQSTGSNDFKMVVFGDPQPYNIDQVDYFAEDIVQELVGRKDLKFGMTMGDIVGDSLDLFGPINHAVSQIGIPWYNVMGNHDINYDAPNDILSDETYERIYGPSTYAFVYGDVHFIVVDDIIHESKAGSRRYVGGLRPDQLEFVENYLATVSREDLVVLTMHIPLAMHGETFRKSDQKKLFDLLKDFPNTLSISAHTHVQNNRFFGQDSTHWHQSEPHHHYNVGTTSGSWWNGLKGENDIPHTMMRDGTPNGYSFISFKGTDYVIDWKAAGSSPDHRMNIHVPRGIISGSKDTTLLTVNFFNGSEQTRVEYRIKGLSQWKKMEQVHKIDPFYGRIHKRWNYFKELGTLDQMRDPKTDPEFTISDWDLPQPQPSSHLWEADLGTEWPAGTHTIEVRVKDRYGRTFTGHQIMRVKNPS